ncbi:hypothetical protein ES319_D11G284400v1 [Gossypium barbadense]|uniref:GTD-binding domain-containing protein n=1 Tax=Gossypium barbadense TaxID=3634 RepID=A0A5J5PFM2_GOSBA|nr:hypothetical protein ES319_D11G284400v1 [Gossypium barbadense]
MPKPIGYWSESWGILIVVLRRIPHLGIINLDVQLKDTVLVAMSHGCQERHGHDEQNRSSDVSVWFQATHQRKNQPDTLSHVVYSELQIDSESESEVKNDAGGEEDGIIIQTHHLKQDLVDQHVQPESQTFTLSDNFASEKFMDPVSALKPSIFISQSESESESAIIEPLGTIPAESTDLKQHGLEELNWEQASTKIEPSASSKLISIDDVPLSSMDKEASIDVSTEMNLSSIDKVSPWSNAGEIPNQGSEDGKLISLDFLSSSPIDNETLVEVPKESKNISVDNVSPSNVAASSVKESKESSVIETPEVEKISEAKCEEIHVSAEQPLPLPESLVEENRVMNGKSIQAINSLDLSDAYKLAVGSKGRQLSGLLVEQWIGRDSSRLSEDLKVLLSQLSSRGMEQLMSDVSPRIAASPRIVVSPRISINSDDLKASDSSAFNGIEILQRRVSLERNESGLSLDGSIVSEIEGESVVDRLKRQVEHDRKLLSALYKELEEERNASAVSTNQAMAMITRLQEEKATLQMEALQHLRMMEEQAEYDMEALQNTNDLLAEKEKEIQDLEAELEFYRLKFPSEFMPADIVKSAYNLQVTRDTMDHLEANSIEEKAILHTDTVTEKPNIGSTAEETYQLFEDTNKVTMKNPLSEHEHGYQQELIP